MHCLCIACTRSFYMGFTSAEGKKLECFKLTVNDISKFTMKLYYTRHVAKSCCYFISPKLFQGVYSNLYKPELTLSHARPIMQGPPCTAHHAGLTMHDPPCTAHHAYTQLTRPHFPLVTLVKKLCKIVPKEGTIWTKP